MFSRTKLKEPVERTIMPVWPAKNAEVQALASDTPGGNTFVRLTNVSTRLSAHYGIPFQNSTPLLYYNVAAFTDAGLDPDHPPASWTDWIAAAKRRATRSLHLALARARTRP